MRYIIVLMCIVLIAPAVQSDSSFSIIRWFEWNKTNLNIYMSPYFNQVQKNTFLLATNHWKQTIQNADDESYNIQKPHALIKLEENKLINISGNVWGTGSQTAGVVVMVAQSGTTFIPLRCTDDGVLVTGSVAL